jgi:hypothetical protein
MSIEITHLAVLEELEGKFKNKQWDEEDVYRWCQQVETLYIADPDSMWKYLNIHLPVSGGRVLLPANLYKLDDVFDPETKKRVRFNRAGKVLKQLINYDCDTIAINYIGTPINKDCMPVINEDHIMACETFCKISGFEGDALYNELNYNLYQDWKVRFDGMIQGVKGGFKDWSAQDYGDMMTIMGNEIPRIGYQPLVTKYYGQDETD